MTTETKPAFLDRLAGRGYLVADGAMGTGLFKRGLETGDAPELWNIDFPERVASVHQEYVDAGCDIILTNSFGGSSYRLKLHNAQDRVNELAEAAARVARGVADAAARPVYVAGSIGPTGELLEPNGPVTLAEAADAFAEQAEGLRAGGADILWVETMSSREEVEAALIGAARTGLPLVATMTFDTAGCTMMGLTPADAYQHISSLEAKPAAIGANCGLGATENAMSVLGLNDVAPENAILVAKANCGIPEFKDGAFRYTGTPELMAEYARLARDAGARIIGGCCGTDGAVLKAMVDALDGYTPGSAPTPLELVRKLGPTATLTEEKLLQQDQDGPSEEGDRPRRNRRRRRDG